MKTYVVEIKFNVIDSAGSPSVDNGNEICERLSSFIDLAVNKLAERSTIAVTPVSISLELA